LRLKKNSRAIEREEAQCILAARSISSLEFDELCNTKRELSQDDQFAMRKFRIARALQLPELLDLGVHVQQQPQLPESKRNTANDPTIRPFTASDYARWQQAEQQHSITAEELTLKARYESALETIANNGSEKDLRKWRQLYQFLLADDVLVRRNAWRIREEECTHEVSKQPETLAEIQKLADLLQLEFGTNMSMRGAGDVDDLLWSFLTNDCSKWLGSRMLRPSSGNSSSESTAEGKRPTKLVIMKRFITVLHQLFPKQIIAKPTAKKSNGLRIYNVEWSLTTAMQSAHNYFSNWSSGFPKLKSWAERLMALHYKQPTTSKSSSTDGQHQNVANSMIWVNPGPMCARVS
jgi:hypothetical protein